jgi:L-iditol 2-dehydrogenase
MTMRGTMMQKTMIAAVMNEVGLLTMETSAIPDIGEDDALIRIGYVGVCGSDMALFANGYIGRSVVDGPMVLGHEASGTVVEIGRNVTNVKPGDRVALEPGVPCLKCEFCKSGKYNICPDVYFWASLPVKEGAFQEYVRHPATFCFPLPDHVSLLEGALIEPLSVGFHAVLQSGAKLGSSAVILGAGFVGLGTMMCLKAAGVRDVVVVDLVENRLDVVRQLGGQAITASSDGDLFAEIATIFPNGPDYVFETAGNATTMDQAIRIVKRGGTITFVGYTKDGRADLDVNLLIDKEVTVKTVFRYRNIYPRAIAAVGSGAIPLREIAFNIYPFSDIQTGMDYAVHHKAEVTKCVICVSPEERP